MTKPKWMNFRKSSKGRGGGGSFSMKKFILKILGLYTGLYGGFFGKKLQFDFPKMRGGGDQRPFGIFPKIHPFWISFSLKKIFTFNAMVTSLLAEIWGEKRQSSNISQSSESSLQCGTKISIFGHLLGSPDLRK